MEVVTLTYSLLHVCRLDAFSAAHVQWLNRYTDNAADSLRTHCRLFYAIYISG